jgi:hypothetical protein
MVVSAPGAARPVASANHFADTAMFASDAKLVFAVDISIHDFQITGAPQLPSRRAEQASGGTARCAFAHPTLLESQSADFETGNLPIRCTYTGL